MRIHHLNCISSCPAGGYLMDSRTSSITRRGRICNHCLLLEGDHGLALVDTGFGLRDVMRPNSRLSPYFLSLLRPEFKEERTAIRQIKGLGFKADDVRDSFLTHVA